MRFTGWMLLLVMGASSAIGCSGMASLQDWQYSWANKQRASAAYKSQLTSSERRALGAITATVLRRASMMPRPVVVARPCGTTAVLLVDQVPGL
ncbi:MAG: hypothetical protein R3C56_02915 [Pirellulaceae bacterium]